MIFEGDKYFPVCVVGSLKGFEDEEQASCYHKESAFHDEN